MAGTGKKSGFALVAIVFLLMAVVNIVAMAFVFGAGSRAIVARKQIFLEEAVYVAEGGAECAVAHLLSGGGRAGHLVTIAR